MIGFFRKIRKKLSDDNKPVKYARYAIGEILLVVIGILIALQVNIYNEKRKKRIEEKEYLIMLKTGLNGALIVNDASMRYMNGVPRSCTILLNHLEKDLGYNDSLRFHFGNTILIYPTLLPVKLIQNYNSNGIGLITNEKLRVKLLTLIAIHEEIYKPKRQLYEHNIAVTSRNMLKSRFDGMWINNFEEAYDPEKHEMPELKFSMIPINYEKLKTDQEYLFFLRSLKNDFFFHVELPFRDLENQMKDIVKDIDHELESMEKV